MIPSTPQVIGFFNLFVGLMLVCSIVLFIGGFIMYLVRLGTWPTYRDEAVKIMQWGVSVLFVLVVLLAVQQFLARNLLAAVSIAAAIIIGIIVWAVISEATAKPPAAPRRRNGGDE